MRSSRYAVRAYARRTRLTRTGALSAVAAVTVSGLVVGLGLPSASAAGNGHQVAATVTGTVERVDLDDFTHPLPSDADELTFVRTIDGALRCRRTTSRTCRTGDRPARGSRTPAALA